MKSLKIDNLTGTNHAGNRANNPVKSLTATSIIGDKIYNPEGEHLGRIKDLMLDIIDGKIDYVVIEFGGFMGLGEKYFAIPYKALVINTERQVFILDQKKEVLEEAPGFDKDHWPETNAHDIHANTAYWGGFMGANTGSKY